MRECLMCKNEIPLFYPSGVKNVNKKFCSPKCYGESCQKKRDQKEKKVYKNWYRLKQKCFNKNFPGYKHYGDKGKRICLSWMKFENYYNWFKSNYIEGHDFLWLKDGEKLYSPENCILLPRSIMLRKLFKNKIYNLKIGQKFGWLTVVGEIYVKRGSGEKLQMICQCQCKNFKNVDASHLALGTITHCDKCRTGKKYSWSKKYPECIQCHSLKFPHRGHGICCKCKRLNKSRHYWRNEFLALLDFRLTQIPCTKLNFTLK